MTSFSQKSSSLSQMSSSTFQMSSFTFQMSSFIPRQGSKPSVYRLGLMGHLSNRRSHAFYILKSIDWLMVCQSINQSINQTANLSILNLVCSTIYIINVGIIFVHLSIIETHINGCSIAHPRWDFNLPIRAEDAQK